MVIFYKHAQSLTTTKKREKRGWRRGMENRRETRHKKRVSWKKEALVCAHACAVCNSNAHAYVWLIPTLERMDVHTYVRNFMVCIYSVKHTSALLLVTKYREDHSTFSTNLATFLSLLFFFPKRNSLRNYIRIRVKK